MYSKLVGSKVKVVHRDGDNIAVTVGEVLEWDDDIKTLCVFREDRKRRIFINAAAIDKLEELEEAMQ